MRNSAKFCRRAKGIAVSDLHFKLIFCEWLKDRLNDPLMRHERRYVSMDLLDDASTLVACCVVVPAESPQEKHRKTVWLSRGWSNALLSAVI